MYSIYYYNHYSSVAPSAPHLLYSPRVASCGLLSGEWKTELNKPGSLQFTPAPDNPAQLTKLTTECALLRDGLEIWRGRVLYDEGELKKQRKVLCEGLLAYLRDGVVPPYTFNGNASELLSDLIETYNDGQTDTWKKFELGDVGDFNDVQVKIEQKDYRKISDEVNNLISKAGGYVSVFRSTVTGKNVINWTQRSGQHCGQKIRFGENLLDLKDKISAEELFTVLIPLGKRSTADAETSYGGDGATVEANTNADRIYNYLKTTMGLTTAAACGVLANMEAESNFDPAYSSGTKFGLCAWSGDRLAQLQARTDYNTLNGQLAFLKWELENLFVDVLRYIRGCSNSGRGAYDAAYYLSYDYFIPEDRAAESRSRGNSAINDYWPTYSAASSSGEVITPALGERLTIADVNDGDIYLVNDATEQIFGRIWKTISYDDVEDASELKTKGLAELQKSVMLRKIELNAVDLSELGFDVDALVTGEYCDLIVPPLNLVMEGLDAPNFTKADVNILAIEKSKFTIGADFKDITNRSAASAKNVKQMLEGADGITFLSAAAQSYAVSAKTSAENASGSAVDAMAAAAQSQTVLSSLPASIAEATAALQISFTLDQSQNMTCNKTVHDVITAIRAGKSIIGTNNATNDVCSFAVSYSKSGSAYTIRFRAEALGKTWSAAGLAENDVIILSIN